MDNKFITCPICKNIYSNPKLLPCLDTICLSCLTQNGNNIRCPICSSTSLVPAGGCDTLPDNMLIRKMLEIVRTVPAPSLDKFCDVCSDEQGGSSDHGSHRCVDTNNTAETFCVECEQNLCSSCGNMYRKVKATRSHTLVGICDQGGSKITSKSRVSRCEQHPSECVTLYCWNCSKLLCTVCYVSSHRQHECSDVRNAVGKFVELVNRNLPLLTAKLESNRQTEQQVEEMKLRFARQVSGVEAEVERKAEEMHALIVRHKRDLLEKMEKINQQVSGEFQQVEQKLKNEIDAASGFIPALHELLDSGSDIDRASLIKDVNIQIQRILSSRPQVIPSTDVTFVGSGGRKPPEPMLPKKYQGFLMGNIVDPRNGQPEATNLIGEINVSTTSGAATKFNQQSPLFGAAKASSGFGQTGTSFSFATSSGRGIPETRAGTKPPGLSDLYGAGGYSPHFGYIADQGPGNGPFGQPTSFNTNQPAFGNNPSGFGNP